MIVKDVCILDKDLVQLGIVNSYKGMVFPKALVGYSIFELYAPITESNVELLKDGNIIYIDAETAGIIESIKKTRNDNGEKVLEVKGRTLEMLLTTRIVWDVYSTSNKKPSVIMEELVDVNCISPSDSKRKIPHLDKIPTMGDNNSAIKTFQQTGGEVYESLSLLATTYNLGFTIDVYPKEGKFKFYILCGTDRTDSQIVNDPIVFDADMQDILSSEYIKSTMELKNIALVAGQIDESTSVRTIVQTGELETSGFDRRELYVDARDISDKHTVGEAEVQYTTEEYEQLLTERGDSKLSEYIVTESFEMALATRTTSHIYGKDYFLGDKVTVYDAEVGVKVDAVVTKIEKTWDGGNYTLTHTFGFSNLSLIRKIKRMM